MAAATTEEAPQRSSPEVDTHIAFIEHCTTLLQSVVQQKWLVLMLVCFLNAGLAYTIDFPGSLGCGSPYAIESRFRRHGKPYNQRMNQSLYSVYSWPNIPLAVFGGFLVDKYLGASRSLVVFSSLIWIGMLLFDVGVRSTSFAMMVSGRVIYGLGGESLNVAMSTFLSKWFSRSGEFSFAFSVSLCCARLVSSSNYILSPIAARIHGTCNAVTIGTILCAVSLFAAIALHALDECASCESNCEENAPEDDSTDANEPAAFSMVKHFSLGFWLLCAVCVFSYGSFVPLIGVAKIFFQVKYNDSDTQASRHVSSYQLTSAIVSPFVGMGVDRIGRNTYFLVAVTGGLCVIHILIRFTMIAPLLIMIPVGLLSSTLAASLWPAVPFVVSKNWVALGYGIMTSLQNVILAILPMVVGYILDGSNTDADSPDALPPLEGFELAITLFLASALLSLFVSLALLFNDKRHLRVLSQSGNSRRGVLVEAPASDEEGEDDTRASLLAHAEPIHAE